MCLSICLSIYLYIYLSIDSPVVALIYPPFTWYTGIPVGSLSWRSAVVVLVFGWPCSLRVQLSASFGLQILIKMYPEIYQTGS